MGQITKENELRKKVTWCINSAFCLFEMGFSHVIYRGFFIINWCLILVVSKTEKQSLEHISKTICGWHKALIYVWFIILTKVLIYSVCQISASLTNITSITASANKFTKTLEWCSLGYESFVEKAHRSFWLVKANLPLTLL